MSKPQASGSHGTAPWPSSTSRRSGFGSSFATRSNGNKRDQNTRTTQDGYSTSASDTFSTRDNQSVATLTPNTGAPSLAGSSSRPVSVDNSPRETTSTVLTDQQQLSKQISQLAGNVATCVHQNELVISLLERLVKLSESMAGPRKSANIATNEAQKHMPSPSSSVASSSHAAFTPKSHKSSNPPTQHQRHDDAASQQFGSVHINTSPREPVVANFYEATVSASSAIAATASSMLGSMAAGNPLRVDFSSVPSFPASFVVDKPLLNQRNYNTIEVPAAGTFLIDHASKGLNNTRRASLRISNLAQDDSSQGILASMQDDQHDGEQTQSWKRRRIECQDKSLSEEPLQSAADNSASAVGSWQDWTTPRQIDWSILQRLPRAKYRTLREARAEIKASSSRPSGAVGRIPLKQYLEVSGPEECRAVRRLGRQLYNAWLEPNTRLGKQDITRLTACINCIEHTFPILADCEEHWKARQVILQVIDNAIDEHKSNERRISSTHKVSAVDVDTPKRGRPKGTTAAAMAQRRRQEGSHQPDRRSQHYQANSSRSSDSESDQ